MTSRITEPTAVDSQADGWVRALDAQQSEEARTEFTEWVLHSPDHLSAYLEQQALATELAAVDPDREIDVEALICELKARQKTAEARKSRKVAKESQPQTAGLPSASKSGLAPGSHSTPTAPRPPDTRKPDQPRFLLVVILRVSLGKAWNFYTRSRQSKWITASVCATVMTLLVHDTTFPPPPERTATEQVTTGSYATAFGKHQCEKLPEGSAVCLNSASEIHYTYTRNARNVVLVRGEATFDVQPDNTRRFNVLSGRSVIQDIGTSFDVYIEADSTLVTVIEGQIRILSPINAAPDLNIDLRQHALESAGNDMIAPEFHKLQQVELSRTTGAMRMLPALTEERLSQLLAWRQGRIDLAGMQLGAALGQLSRYHIERFEFADETLSRTRVGGSVDCAHLDDFLSLLEIEFGIHHKTTTGADGLPVITLWRARGKSPED